MTTSREATQAVASAPGRAAPGGGVPPGGGGGRRPPRVRERELVALLSPGVGRDRVVRRREPVPEEAIPRPPVVFVVHGGRAAAHGQQRSRVLARTARQLRREEVVERAGFKTGGESGAAARAEVRGSARKPQPGSPRLRGRAREAVDPLTLLDESSRAHRRVAERRERQRRDA